MARVEHRAGALRHRLVIQQEQRTPDGAGGFDITWPDFATVWGSVQPISGNEALVARQLQDTVTHKVVIRYDGAKPVVAAMRIKFGTRYFNIREVRNFDERNWKLELRCEEGGAQ